MNVSLSIAAALTALLAATTVWAQAPQAQGPAGVAAQGSASAQSTSQPGAHATAAGSTQAGATASESNGQSGSSLAAGSSVNAVLSKPVDSEHSKPGDPVRARTTQPAKTEDGTLIPSGSELVGHIAPVEAGAGGAAGSSVALVFDRAVLKGDHEVPLRLSIRALAAAESRAAAGTGDSRAMMGASGSMAGGGRAGLGGGVVGRAGGAVGGTVGGAVGGAGSMAATGMGALQPGPGASGGLDASGLLTTQSVGVFGLRGVSLATGDLASATGSVVTSGGKRLRLDEGTRLLLTSSATAGHETSDSKKPAGKSEPDRR